MNHIRADIKFNIKRKRKLFNPGSLLHIWFEMVNCKTETDSVKGFKRKERLPVNKIFSDTKHKYDENFWGNFNVIVPEDKLKEFILSNLNEIIENSDEE